MGKTAHELVNSPKFKKLVATRWSVSMILTIALFIVYYGYILCVGYNKELLKVKVGEATNLGILFGVGSIIIPWFLTVIYVLWANNVYDKEVTELKNELIQK